MGKVYSTGDIQGANCTIEGIQEEKRGQGQGSAIEKKVGVRFRNACVVVVNTLIYAKHP